MGSVSAHVSLHSLHGLSSAPARCAISKRPGVAGVYQCVLYQLTVRPVHSLQTARRRRDRLNGVKNSSETRRRRFVCFSFFLFLRRLRSSVRPYLYGTPFPSSRASGVDRARGGGPSELAALVRPSRPPWPTSQGSIAHPYRSSVFGV